MRKILVVDDNQDVCEMLKSLLAVTGHVAEMAYDGPHAIKVAQQFLPDIILLDIGLPDMDGWEIAKQLRQMPLFQKTLIFALSGYGEAADHQRSLDAGMNHHFVKPLDLEDLWQVAAQHGMTP